MSRLTENDVAQLSRRLKDYDRHLKGICGEGLGGIARNAAKKSVSAKGARVGVVPVTSGLGIIGGFCGAVAAVAAFLGADAFVTENTDIKGLLEAAGKKCDVLFTADDNTFIALNLSKGLASDNSEATGRGFAAALDLAAAGIAGKQVLVLGAGPVGRSAATVLSGRGAKVTVCDINPEKAAFLQECLPEIQISGDLRNALKEIPFVLDATPSAGFIKGGMLREDTVFAMPGVPSGLDGGAAEFLKNRLICDVLDIGVATMLFDTL